MKKLLLLIAGAMILFSSCKKFLDEKSDKSFAVPETLGDMQALLDQQLVMVSGDSFAAEVSNTDYYLTDNDLASRPEYEVNMYSWKRAHIYPDLTEWFNNYRIVYRANSVITFLDKINRNAGNSSEWDFIKGQAHFFRAKAYMRSLFVWAPSYDENTANTDLGIVLREGTDFNLPSVRSNVADSYAQVIADFKKAIRTLPSSSAYLTRPAKPAAYGMLARTYLAMRKYNEALLYADSCLKLKSDLLDYNSLNPSAAYPVPTLNKEILYESLFGGALLSNSRAKLDPGLISLYEPNDLRRTLFLKDNNNGTYGFRGNFEGANAFFSGVATDEVFLIRAECYARANKLTEALADLNKLLRNRYVTNTYVDKTSSDQQVVLNWILTERRKELLLRGLRWVDIKRLNKEGAGIELTRTVNGVVHKLKPNGTEFVLPIPEDAIAMSGIPQNP